MTNGVKNWLPIDAFTLDLVKSVLADPIAGWSDSWFTRATASISAVRTGGRQPVATAQSLSIQGSQVVLDVPAHRKRLLLQALLGMDLSTETLGEADRHVLDVFVTKVVEDLVSTVEGAIAGADDTADRGPLVEVTLSMSAHDVLGIWLPVAALVPLVKGHLGGAREQLAAPRNRSEALRGTQIAMNAVVGRAELTMNDLQELNAGDVLILDRALNEPIELRVPGNNQAFAAGKLCRHNGQISIQL